MPTIISHPAVPLGISLALAEKVSARLIFAGIIASILPDADVIGLYLGIPYSHTFSHRGFSHSIFFALFMGLLGLVMADKLRTDRFTGFLVLFLSTLSHCVLDAMTSGGLGIAFFSPFSNERFFFPWRPIRVSPLSLSGFFSGRGLIVIRSEIIWVWIPSLFMGICGFVLKKKFLTNRKTKFLL